MPEDHKKALDDNATLMSCQRNRFQAKASLAITTTGKLALSYFKQRFHVGAVFSAPRDVVNCAREDAKHEHPAPISTATFWELFQRTPSGKDDEVNIQELCFFEVTDAFPEKQYQVRGHRFDFLACGQTHGCELPHVACECCP